MLRWRDYPPCDLRAPDGAPTAPPHATEGSVTIAWVFDGDFEVRFVYEIVWRPRTFDRPGMRHRDDRVGL